jgi:predicted dehydrogenase
MNKNNIILIGFGPHAKRIYYPICQKEEKVYKLRLIYAVDLEDKKDDIIKYLAEKNDKFIKTYFIQPRDRTYERLSSTVEKKLNRIVKQFNVKGVIISTEPQVHKMYARWALNKGLNILMDKPISIHRDISCNPQLPQKLIQDYKELKTSYLAARKKYKRVFFSLMAQRRWHPAFIKIKSLINEVYKETNCPVTSIQTFHGDGQWRLPSEIVDIDYHGFNHGFGKCSHSGYHFFDIVTWLLEAGESREKSIDNVDIFTNFLRPDDFLYQINVQDYKKIFPGFEKYNKYSQKQLNRLFKKYAEIDAFSSFAFKNEDKILTLASINLAHNSFSQRGWLSVTGKDLYKGNGRLRQESHFIEQGPFQSISFISYQSKEVNPIKTQELYDVGGEYHLDIHVFRNNSFFPKWKTYEKVSIKDLNINIMAGKSRGHQEDARRRAVLEFARFLNGEKIKPVSDLLDHERSTKLMYGVYQSAANSFKGLDPLVNIDFRFQKIK